MKIDPRRGGERGTDIHLDRDEVAQAIDDYLEKHKVIVTGPRTVRITEHGSVSVFVDPEGSVEMGTVTMEEAINALKDAICFMKDAERVSIRSKAIQLEAITDAYDREQGEMIHY